MDANQVILAGNNGEISYVDTGQDLQLEQGSRQFITSNETIQQGVVFATPTTATEQIQQQQSHYIVIQQSVHQPQTETTQYLSSYVQNQAVPIQTGNYPLQITLQSAKQTQIAQIAGNQSVPMVAQTVDSQLVSARPIQQIQVEDRKFQYLVPQNNVGSRTVLMRNKDGPIQFIQLHTAGGAMTTLPVQSQRLQLPTKSPVRNQERPSTSQSLMNQQQQQPMPQQQQQPRPQQQQQPRPQQQQRVALCHQFPHPNQPLRPTKVTSSQSRKAKSVPVVCKASEQLVKQTSKCMAAAQQEGQRISQLINDQTKETNEALKRNNQPRAVNALIQGKTSTPDQFKQTTMMNNVVVPSNCDNRGYSLSITETEDNNSSAVAIPVTMTDAITIETSDRKKIPKKVNWNQYKARDQQLKFSTEKVNSQNTTIVKTEPKSEITLGKTNMDAQYKIMNNKKSKTLLCTNCGCENDIRQSCQRCHRSLHKLNKRFTSASGIEITKKEVPMVTPNVVGQSTVTQIIRKPEFYGHTKPGTIRVVNDKKVPITVATVRGGKVVNAPKRSRSKAKAFDEPEILTLSSDDDDDENSKTSTNSGPASSSAESQVVAAPSQPAVPVMAKKISPKEPNLVPDIEDTLCSLHNCLVRPSNKNPLKYGTETEIGLNCKNIRIGTLRFLPTEPVTLCYMKSLTFKTPKHIITQGPIAESEPQFIEIVIPFDRIIKILIHFGQKNPVLIVYLRPSEAKKIRQQLNMVDKNGSYFDPVSDVQQHRRIIIHADKYDQKMQNMLKEFFHFEQYNKLTNSTFKVVEEITMKEANDITVYSASQQAQAIERKVQPEVAKTLLVYPPPPNKGGITITTDDYNCLEEEQFLNDVILDFYFKWLMLTKLSPEDRERTHVFSTFFYKRLTTKSKKSRRCNASEENLTPTQKRHSRVKSWTKNVDIFAKDFILIPINEHSHWFMAVICFPGLDGPVSMGDGTSVPDEPIKQKSTKPKPKMEMPPVEDLDWSDRDEAEGDEEEMEEEDEDEKKTEEEKKVQFLKETKELGVKQPSILIFDSLSGAPRSRIVATLRDYLSEEFKEKKKIRKEFTKLTMKGACPKVPQQTNFSDCGVFTLQFAESFFNNPIKCFRRVRNDLIDWFPQDLVAAKREKIANLIQTLMNEFKPNHGITLPSIHFNSNMPEGVPAELSGAPLPHSEAVRMQENKRKLETMQGTTIQLTQEQIKKLAAGNSLMSVTNKGGTMQSNMVYSLFVQKPGGAQIYKMDKPRDFLVNYPQQMAKAAPSRPPPAPVTSTPCSTSNLASPNSVQMSVASSAPVPVASGNYEEIKDDGQVLLIVNKSGSAPTDNSSAPTSSEVHSSTTEGSLSNQPPDINMETTFLSHSVNSPFEQVKTTQSPSIQSDVTFSSAGQIAMKESGPIVASNSQTNSQVNTPTKQIGPSQLHALKRFNSIKAPKQTNANLVHEQMNVNPLNVTKQSGLNQLNRFQTNKPVQSHNRPAMTSQSFSANNNSTVTKTVTFMPIPVNFNNSSLQTTPITNMKESYSKTKVKSYQDLNSAPSQSEMLFDKMMASSSSNNKPTEEELHQAEMNLIETCFSPPALGPSSAVTVSVSSRVSKEAIIPKPELSDSVSLVASEVVTVSTRRTPSMQASSNSLLEASRSNNTAKGRIFQRSVAPVVEKAKNSSPVSSIPSIEVPISYADSREMNLSNCSPLTYAIINMTNKEYPLPTAVSHSEVNPQPIETLHTTVNAQPIAASHTVMSSEPIEASCTAMNPQQIATSANTAVISQPIETFCNSMAPKPIATSHTVKSSEPIEKSSTSVNPQLIATSHAVMSSLPIEKFCTSVNPQPIATSLTVTSSQPIKKFCSSMNPQPISTPQTAVNLQPIESPLSALNQHILAASTSVENQPSIAPFSTMSSLPIESPPSVESQLELMFKEVTPREQALSDSHLLLGLANERTNPVTVGYEPLTTVNSTILDFNPIPNSETHIQSTSYQEIGHFLSKSYPLPTCETSDSMTNSLVHDEAVSSSMSDSTSVIPSDGYSLTPMQAMETPLTLDTDNSWIQSSGVPSLNQDLCSATQHISSQQPSVIMSPSSGLNKSPVYDYCDSGKLPTVTKPIPVAKKKKLNLDSSLREHSNTSSVQKKLKASISQKNELHSQQLQTVLTAEAKVSLQQDRIPKVQTIGSKQNSTSMTGSPNRNPAESKLSPQSKLNNSTVSNQLFAEESILKASPPKPLKVTPTPKPTPPLRTTRTGRTVATPKRYIDVEYTTPSAKRKKEKLPKSTKR